LDLNTEGFDIPLYASLVVKAPTKFQSRSCRIKPARRRQCYEPERSGRRFGENTSITKRKSVKTRSNFSTFL